MFIRCDKCGRGYNVPDDTRQLTCKYCGTVMIVVDKYVLTMILRPAIIINREKFEHLVAEVRKSVERIMNITGKRKVVTKFG